MTERIGPYEILHELKSGGMGSVLLGRRRGPGAFEQLVAIKTIRAEHARSEAVRAMFLDEAAILARLGHANIATVHDFGDEDGALYMVMEYVAGLSLRDVPDMPAMIAARAVAEGARGLQAAHEARDPAGIPLGLVHRDISPDNLMLGFDGHIKVIDFGIALVKNRQAPATEFGTVKGKPAYMSPEQVKNESMDRRSDVFALGVVLWELLVGRSLFEGDSIYAIAYAVENQDIVAPSQALGRPLPAGLDAAVMAALERDPEKRTPTAAAFAEALEDVVQANAGESLASWAERELAGRRDDHRAWLASITAGDAADGQAGRPTGVRTQLGTPPRATPIVVRASKGTVDPIARTSFGQDGGAGDETAIVPKRRSRAGLAVALLAVLLAGGGIWLAMGGKRAPSSAPRDAAIAAAVPQDAAIAIAPKPAADAAVAVAPKPAADAAVAVAPKPPVVAGHHKPHHEVASAPTLPAQPVGAGQVDLIKVPSDPYATVTIDGALVGYTPIRGYALPAGHHVIRFVSPQSNAVIYTQAIDLADGQHAVVRN